jgi:hypothetical protein
MNNIVEPESDVIEILLTTMDNMATKHTVKPVLISIVPVQQFCSFFAVWPLLSH